MTNRLNPILEPFKMPDEKGNVTISKDTKINIGTAIAIISCVLAVSKMIDSRMQNLSDAIERQAVAVREQAETNKATADAVKLNADEIAKLKAGTWTIAQQSEHALRTVLANPSIRMPDPRSPGKFIQFDGAKRITAKGEIDD